MIHVVQEARSESLFDRLAEDLAAAPPGPAAREVVIVESVGMARRLPLELATRLGGVAGLHTPFPARFLWDELLRPADEAAGARSPWEPEALAWRIAALLPACLEGPGSEAVARLLERDRAGNLRHGLARRLAGLFDQYLVYRPRWLLDWEGHPEAARLPGGEPPPDSPTLVWQRQLWRRLRRDLPQPQRANLQADWLATLERTGPPAGLPPRLSLFALGSLPPAQLDLFDALARHLPVRLYLLNPSREYWGDLPGRRPRQAMEEAEGRAPLLAACGSELGAWIDELLERDAEFRGPQDEPPAPRTLLGHLQSSLFHVSPLPDPLPLDDSLQFHSCHSPQRQVEVLLDCLLDLFEREPELSPGDVLVLCPELESVRPAFEAVFSSQEPARQIPWRVLGPATGRGLGVVLAELLQLAGGRWESGRVLAPLQCAALRRRQGLEVDALAIALDWCRAAGIRWGWDAESRRRLGLPAVDEHSWRAGLDRLLLGYAMSRDSLVEGLVALPAAGEKPERLQAFFEWLQTLRRFEAEIESPRTPEGWTRWLLEWLPRFFSPDEEEERELHELRERLLSGEAAARAGAAAEALAFGSARDFLLRTLAEDEGIRGGGFDGRLTLAPMLACHGLPARVIVLLGLDDTVFPRPSRRDELDLCLSPCRRGDRQPRLQDRALFLEALGCARDNLLLFWTGRDVKENRRRPPSTVVSELLDLLGDPAGHVREHALQAFSPAAFSPQARPAGHHPGWGRAAQRLARARREPAELVASHPLLDALDLPEPARELTLEELEAFQTNPARSLLRRAGLSLPWDGGHPAEEEPFASDRPTLGRLRHTLLRWAGQGLPEGEQEPRLRAAGLLPWGHPGRAELLAGRSEAQDLLERRTLALQGEDLPETRDVELRIDGFRLRANLPAPAPRRVECWARRRAGSALGTPWLRHLVWSAQGGAGVSHLIFLDEELELPAVADPVARLREWLEAWRLGQLAWLPWLPAVSEALALECLQAQSEEREPELEKEWYRQREYLWEDPWLQTVLGGADPFTHPGIAPRLVEWALRLGAPLQEALA